MNKIQVLFFATFRDRAGTRQAAMEIPVGAQVAQFKALLADKFPGLREAMSSALVAVNKDYAFDKDVIPSGAEVALFPPVSGG